MPSLNEIKERFQADRFATETTGVEILQAEPNHAVCQLVLRPEHYNAAHTPQGGAIFTLADLAFAVAANGFAEHITISLQTDISFLAASRGKVLTAEATCLKKGGTVSLYAVDVTDDLGAMVAHMTVNGFTVKPRK